jgi:hypothetical protein
VTPKREVPARSRVVLRKKKPKKQFKASTVADNAEDNPRVIANQLRALQREMRAGFELLGNKLLVTMERMDQRQDAFGAELAELRRRIAELEAKLEAKTS